jgi:uncharacterized protein involved in outer membrane biogenesis
MAQTDPTHPRRRVLRILLIVLAAVILLPVLAVLAVVAMFDADAAKPRIIAAVQAATGRELVIAGPIRLVPALHPSIELTDATLSNPPGFSRPQMAMLKRLDLQLALLPLLDRRIEIDRLVLRGADILLEMNAQGQGNWRFTPQAAEPRPAEQRPAQPPAASKAPAAAIRIDRIEIADSQVAYRNARMAAPEVLAVSALTLTAGAADQPLNLSMAASADNAPFTLSGRFGPSAALLGSPGLPLELDLTLAASGATLSLAGTIADPVQLSGTDLRLKAGIPDLAALSGLAHTELPSLRGIIAAGRTTDLTGKPGLLTGFTLHDLRIALPQAEFDGEVSITRGSPPMLQGTLHAARIDADALRAAVRAAAVSPAPGAATAPAAKPTPPARLIPDQELPLEMLRAVDADLALAIGELIQGGVTYRDLAGHLALKAAALRIDPLTVTIPGGPVRLTVAADAGKPAPAVAVTISAPSLGLAPLLAAFKLPPYAQGNLRLDADLHGTGRSPHQLAATLDGSIGLSMENAQIDTRALSDVLNSADLLKNVDLLKNGAGLTALRCLAVRMDVRNGAGTLRTLLLDTAPARLSGSGGLNLEQETLAIRLQTTIRMGATAIGAPLDVSGTFLAPKVKIDAAAPLAGAAAGAAGNTPFGLVIGKLGHDQLAQGAMGESCAHDLAIARGETPPTEHAPEPSQPPSQPSSQPAVKPPNPADLLRQLLR